MHERTQRAIARLMFVFCCAVPTLITLSCLLVTWTPWYHQRSLRAIELALSRETGLVVKIRDFRRPAPSTLSLTEVRLLQPETGREVAQVRQLEWVSGSDEVSVLLHQPRLQSGELPSVWRMIHDRFLCRPEHTTMPVRLAANDLTVHSRSGAQTFRDVDGWIQPYAEVIEATIQGLPAISRPGSPVTVSVRRDRSGEEPATLWSLDTNGTPLPCSALAEYLPLLESLGSEAMFSGTMCWQLQANGCWWIDLGGSRFEQIALDRLFERQVHRFSGRASVQFERCRIEPFNRRSDIAGSFRAADGLIAQSLLLSVHQQLGFQVQLPEELLAGRRDVPYDRIALAFKVNNTQLQLDGICRSELGYESFPPGVVLSLDLQPLVRSAGQTLDSLKLISVIAPPHSVGVPLSSQTSALIHVFIPPARPLPRDGDFPPRIRSAENWSGGPTIAQPY